MLTLQDDDVQMPLRLIYPESVVHDTFDAIADGSLNEHSSTAVFAVIAELLILQNSVVAAAVTEQD